MRANHAWIIDTRVSLPRSRSAKMHWQFCSSRDYLNDFLLILMFSFFKKNLLPKPMAYRLPHLLPRRSLLGSLIVLQQRPLRHQKSYQAKNPG